MIGVDTSALIDIYKNNPNISKLLESINEPIFLNQMTYLELILGLDLDNKKHKEEEEFYDNLFSSISNLNLDLHSSIMSVK